MDELLHHWQISLISQGRVWVCIQRHTHTQTHMHACTLMSVCGHTHAFYQSNLIGKSMLWLANRELMQSRGSPPLSFLLSQSLLICLSHVLLLPSRLFSLYLHFSLVSFFWKTTKQNLHAVCRQAGQNPADSLSQSLDSSWIFILQHISHV